MGWEETAHQQIVELKKVQFIEEGEYLEELAEYSSDFTV